MLNRQPLSMSCSLGGSVTEFPVSSIRGTERLSGPYEFRVEFDPMDHQRELFAALLGTAVTLMIGPSSDFVPDPEGEEADELSVTYGDEGSALPGAWRRVHGIVAALERRVGASTLYEATVVSPLARLALSSAIRVHPAGMTPVQVAITLLKEHGIEIAPEDQRLRGDYQARDFTVQYRETDSDFFQRLLEEEGITFFFEHAEDGPRLVLSDDPAAFTPVCVQATLPLAAGGLVHGGEVVFSLSERMQLTPGKVTLGDRNPKKPLLELKSVGKATGFGELGSVFEFFSRFGEQKRGDRLARTVKERLEVSKLTATATTSSNRLVPGRVITIGESAIEYLIVSVAHSAYSAEEYRYTNVVTLFPLSSSASSTRAAFRPAARHSRPVARGVHTATVVARDGSATREGTDADEHGRVRVRFHWDRDGATSHWIRVAQAWAGPGYGAFFTPMIGNEVAVSFLDGDPDHPIIIGSLHNTISPVPDGAGLNMIRSHGGSELAFDQAGETVRLRAKTKIVIAADEIELRSNNVHSNLAIQTTGGGYTPTLLPPPDVSAEPGLGSDDVVDGDPAATWSAGASPVESTGEAPAPIADSPTASAPSDPAPTSEEAPASSGVTAAIKDGVISGVTKSLANAATDYVLAQLKGS